MEKELATIVTGLIFLVLVAAFWKLYLEQKKLRVESAHQLNRDLISKRASAYACLWSKMRSLAIYSNESFNSKISERLYEELSNWYFSETGGLFLTNRAREFYFALQNVLQSFGNMNDWDCPERPANPHRLFVTMLEGMAEENDNIKDVLGKIDPVKWKSSCELIAEHLASLVNKSQAQTGGLIFASAQQISSILRTNLTYEVHSRLNVDWPEI